MTHRRTIRSGALLCWIGLALVLLWGAVLIESGGSVVQAVHVLSRALVRGTSRLAESVLSGWFILALVSAPVILSLLRDLLPRTRRLEVGHLRLEFAAPDLADLALLEGPPAVPLEEWTPIPRHEMAGTDGPIQQEPPLDHAYQDCMARLPGLFRDLSAENQHAKGEALRLLESGWPGEYLPELIASVTHLRACARRNRVVLEGYLSITLLFRHLMLFFQGRQEHAVLLVQDLDLLAEHDRMGFLRRPAMLWVLLSLSRQKAWPQIETLRRLLVPGSPEHAAVAAHEELARGCPEAAISVASVALADEPPINAVTALLLVTLGRALLEVGRPLEAIGPARRVLDTPLANDAGLAVPLRTGARQVLVRAAVLLEWPAPIYSLYGVDPEGQRDPVLLHALSLLTNRAGQRSQAEQFIRQARALVPTGCKELDHAIHATARWIERE